MVNNSSQSSLSILQTSQLMISSVVINQSWSQDQFKTAPLLAVHCPSLRIKNNDFK